MEIITHESEILLTDFLPLIQEEPDSWMCVHVNMAPLNEEVLNTEGLSRQAIEGFHLISIKIAQKIGELGLNTLDGRIFVFEDGDVLGLYLCTHESGAIIEKLREEFRSSGLLSIFSAYSMQDKLNSLIALSREKKETAKEFNSQINALDKVDALLALAEPDRELTRAIQKKRMQRTSGVVLVIEDDLIARGLIAAGLKKDYKVVQAKDGKNGIAAYMAHAPNLVLLDIHLPDLNGHEVLSRLSFLDPETYVVMLSVDSVEDNVLLAQNQGAIGFIKKPFSKDLIVEYIQKCPSLSSDARARALGWTKMSNPFKLS